MDKLGGSVVSVHNHIPEAKSDPQKLKGLKLLLGMNDAINMLYMTHIFERCEVNADVGGKVNSILSLAESNSYDVVILDTSIPKTDDVSLINSIIELQGGAHKAVPIAVLTAYPFPEKIIPLKEAGIKGIISKPYSEDDIVLALTELLKKS